MWVRAWYNHAKEGHTVSSCGHHWLGWQVPLLGGIAGARTYKVISSSRQKNLPRNHWAAGKEEAVCCGSRSICSSHPSKAKGMWSCRKKAFKMGLWDEKKKSWKPYTGWIPGLYQYLFLALQYHLQAPVQGWTLHREDGFITHGGQVRALNLHGSLSGGKGGFGWSSAHTVRQAYPTLHRCIHCPNQSPQPNQRPCKKTRMEEGCNENKPKNGLWGGKLRVLPRNQVTMLFPAPFAKGQIFVLRQQEKPWHADPKQGCPAPQPTPKWGARVEGATARPSPQRLSPRLRWARDHRRAAVSAQETSDGVGARVIHLFLEKFFHSEIIHTADHRNTCKHEI